MAPPPVTIYVTSLTSAPKVRQHIELLRRSLKGWEIPYEEFDLVNDEEAKRRWQRAKPSGQVIGLPGYLVGGEWVGTMDDFDDAVETQTLPTFLKQDLDLSIPSGAGGAAGGARNVSVGEAELEKLMREMTDEDLDKLVSELGVGEGTGKVGLMVPAGAEAEVEEETAGAAKTDLAKSNPIDSETTNAPVDAKGADDDERALEEAKDETAVAGEENLAEVVEDAAVALGEKLGISSTSTADAGAAGTRQADEVGKGESVDALIAAGERAKGKEKVD